MSARRGVEVGESSQDEEGSCGRYCASFFVGETPKSVIIRVGVEFL